MKIAASELQMKLCEEMIDVKDVGYEVYLKGFDQAIVQVKFFENRWRQRLEYHSERFGRNPGGR